MRPTLVALLAAAVAGPLTAQEPGAKPAPPAAANPAAAKEVQKDVQAAVAFELPPTPAVDQAVEEFKKRMKVRLDGSIKTASGRTYLVTFGSATVSGDRKPGWVARRALAMGQAELAGRAELAKAVGVGIQTGQLFEQFDGRTNDVLDRLKELKKVADQGAKGADLYKEAVAIGAAAQVVGAVTAKTIEGDANGEHKVVRVLLWSPELYDLAVNALADTRYFLPPEKVADEGDQLPQAEADLVKEYGVKVYVNKDGQKYYVAFGQAEPVAENAREFPRAVEVAKKRSELNAYGQLARTLAASVTLARADQQEVLKVFDGKETPDKLTQGFYERMEAESKLLKLTGTLTVRQWQYQHPDWKLPVVGSVVVWSPGNRDVVQQLGLGTPIEPNAQGKLIDLLAKKYGIDPPAGAGGKKPVGKPGVTESADPKLP